MKQIRWGVLSTAKIAREKLIPAIQKSKRGSVVALASRNDEKARGLAAQLHIPRAYASYEALLDDPDIEAVYNPLPNHLHVDWTIRALEKGKHVLCEKPIGLSAADALRLKEAAAGSPGLVVMEAFMYRLHPQWLFVKSQVEAGTIGRLVTIQSFFSYYNADPANIRNQTEAAGGALMDIGCYCVSWSRYLFAQEPQRVIALVDRDPSFGTDRLTSGILQFAGGSASFTCSTQAAPYQRAQVIGTDGRLEVEIPVNAPADQPAKVWMHHRDGSHCTEFPAVDQYTLQADAFAQAITEGSEPAVSLTESVNNMRVIDALFESAASEQWVRLSESPQ